MPNANSLEYKLESIDSLGKSFLNQHYFSGFYGASAELANLAVLNSFELNSRLKMELGESDQRKIIEEIEKKKNTANKSSFDYLCVCYKSIESLRKWSVMNGHVVEKHLLDTLSKVLNLFISSFSSGKIKLDDLKKETHAVEKHIYSLEAINNFFKWLKKINQAELQDIGLEKLLQGIDVNRGLIVPAEALTKEITRLIKAVYSYLSEALTPITINNNEDEIRKKKFLLNAFEALGSLQQINLIEKYPFANSDISKVNNLLKNYRSRETFLEEVDRCLIEIKSNIEDKAWDSKAKNTLGPPDGIRKLRKIFNNTNLGPFEKLFSARKILEKKLKSLNRRDAATAYFYDGLSRKLEALYQIFGRDYEEGMKYSFSISSKQIPLLALDKLIDCESFTSLLNELPLTSSKEEDALFSNIHALLIKAQDVVGSQIWDKKGRDIFYRESKCPDGIKEIRSCVKNMSLLGIKNGHFHFDIKALTPVDKVRLLKRYLTLHALVTKKSSHSRTLPLFRYRQKETQCIYDKLAEVTTVLFNFFSESQLDTLKVIKKHNKGTEYAQIIQSLNVIKISEGGNAIFNVEPITSSYPQEKFDEVLTSLDSLIPLSQTTIPTLHYMGF